MKTPKTQTWFYPEAMVMGKWWRLARFRKLGDANTFLTSIGITNAITRTIKSKETFLPIFEKVYGGKK